MTFQLKKNEYKGCVFAREKSIKNVTQKLSDALTSGKMLQICVKSITFRLKLA